MRVKTTPTLAASPLRCPPRGLRLPCDGAAAGETTPTNAGDSHYGASESVTSAPVDDLEILAPDREIEIAGEKLTVRELSFGEQLKHGAALKALVEAFRARLPMLPDAPNSAMVEALTDNADALLELIAVSVGRPLEWLQGLSGDAGEALAIRFWEVNYTFFIRRLFRYPGLDVAIKANGERLAGAMEQAGGGSSPPLPGTDTTRSD